MPLATGLSGSSIEIWSGLNILLRAILNVELYLSLYFVQKDFQELVLAFANDFRKDALSFL